MTPAPAADTTDAFVEQAIPLLKEYHAKVRRLIRRTRGLRGRFESDHASFKYGHDTRPIYQTEFDAITARFARLRPAIARLTQQVSGMVDQGRVTPLTRVELQLRLAELEADALELPELVKAYKPK